MENPDYLILDEPFNGLDQDGVEDVHQLLQKLKTHACWEKIFLWYLF